MDKVGQSWTKLDKVGQIWTKLDKVRQRVVLTLVSFGFFDDPFQNANQRSAVLVRTGIKLDNVGQSCTKLDKVGQSWTKLDKVGQSWTKLDKVGQSWTKSWTKLENVGQSRQSQTKSDKNGPKWTNLDKVRQRDRLTLVSFAFFDDPFRNANQRSAVFVRTGIKLARLAREVIYVENTVRIHLADLVTLYLRNFVPHGWIGNPSMNFSLKIAVSFNDFGLKTIFSKYSVYNLM